MKFLQTNHCFFELEFPNLLITINVPGSEISLHSCGHPDFDILQILQRMGFYLTVKFSNLIALYKTSNINEGLNQFTAEEFFNFTGSFGWVVIKGNKIQGNFFRPLQ